MNRKRWRVRSATAVLVGLCAISAGCPDDVEGGGASDSGTADAFVTGDGAGGGPDIAGLDAVGDAGSDAGTSPDTGGGDTQTLEVAVSVAPGSGLAGAGTVSSSMNYRMVATLGAPLGTPMQASSPKYRMTTSLLSLDEAAR